MVSQNFFGGVNDIFITLVDHDTVSFGKGIFKDGRFHAPHTVTIRLGEIEISKPKSRRLVYTRQYKYRSSEEHNSGTFGLKSYGSEPARLETAASQSEVAEKQAEKIRVRSSFTRPITSTDRTIDRSTAPGSKERRCGSSEAAASRRV